jgi:hypothetical protein
MLVSASSKTTMSRDGPAHEALFEVPQGIAVDSKGNIFVTEYDGNRIRKICRVNWSEKSHKLFDECTRKAIGATLVLWQREGTFFNLLPREILFAVFDFISQPERKQQRSVSAAQ